MEIYLLSWEEASSRAATATRFSASHLCGPFRPQRPPYKLGALRRTYKETKPP